MKGAWHTKLKPGVLLMALLCGAGPLYAEDDDGAQAQLEILKERMVAEPDRRLEHFFTYAKTAETLKMLEEAKAAYLQMLSENPKLDRVKLDLALLYTRMESYDEAKALFAEVLANNPPEAVKKNIATVVEGIKRQTARNIVNGSVTVGYNYDTNANSAASTGEITFLDTRIPLDPNSRRNGDSQYYAALNLNHTLRLKELETKELAFDWNNSATLYGAYQQELDPLDLQLFTVKTGPSVTVKDWAATFGVNAGYTNVRLDNYEYLNIGLAELTANYAYSERLGLNIALSREDRNFVNSPDNQTFTDRNGEAYQLRLGGVYLLSPEHIFSGNVFVRSEETNQAFDDNQQAGAGVGYTLVLPESAFFNLNLSSRLIDYDGRDALISTAVTRRDKEYVAAFMVGRQFFEAVTLSFGYQYRNVDSNIQNYEYDNHRIMANVTYAFRN